VDPTAPARQLAPCGLAAVRRRPFGDGGTQGGAAQRGHAHRFELVKVDRAVVVVVENAHQVPDVLKHNIARNRHAFRNAQQHAARLLIQTYAEILEALSRERSSTPIKLPATPRLFVVYSGWTCLLKFWSSEHASLIRVKEIHQIGKSAVSIALALSTVQCDKKKQIGHSLHVMRLHLFSQPFQVLHEPAASAVAERILPVQARWST
jgi:hypothetical protein